MLATAGLILCLVNLGRGALSLVGFGLGTAGLEVTTGSDGERRGPDQPPATAISR
jgi:hypothetical protein